MLPDHVRTLLRDIQASHPYPDAWLATQDISSGGRVRTVRLEDFDLETASFRIASDARHRKAREISRQPMGELCLVRFEGPVQVRIRCKLSVVDDAQARQTVWSRQPPRVRRRLWDVPEDLDTPPHVFLLLRGDAFELDALDHRPDRPTRSGYLLTPEGWNSERRPV